MSSPTAVPVVHPPLPLHASAPEHEECLGVAGDILLADGIRYEQGGATARAVGAYQSAAELATNAAVRAEAFRRLSNLYRTTCQWDEAISAARVSATIARAARLMNHLADALNVEACAHLELGEYHRAIALLNDALLVATADLTRGKAWQNLGIVDALRQRFEPAERAFAASATFFARAGYAWGAACSTNNTAQMALQRGAVDEAKRLADRAVAEARDVGDLDLVLNTTRTQTEVLIAMADYPAALAQLSHALGYFASADNRVRQAEVYEMMGTVYTRTDPSGAVGQRCFTRALALLNQAVDNDYVSRLRERIRDAQETMRVASAPATTERR